jgi:hypothetical protein
VADSIRRTIIAGLATIVANASSIKTVVTSYTDLDTLNYTAAQVPLMQITPMDESPNYAKSSRGHALWRLNIRLTCYYLDDISGMSVGEGLIKEIKDAIGADGTLGGVCADCSLIRVTPGGEFPLFRLIFDFAAIYERSVWNA